MTTSATLDIFIVSTDAAEIAVFQQMCDEFSYTMQIEPSFEKAVESAPDAVISVISDSAIPQGVSAAEAAQGLKYAIPHAYQISLLREDLSKDKSTFLRKSGSDMIALKSELLDTSKFYFAFSQILHATYLPIKGIDISSNIELPLTVYHFMPQRKKFVPFIFAGDKVSDVKREKMASVSEYYFHRSQANNYHEYVKQTSEKSAAGLAKRCRAAYLTLQAEFTELVLAIADQSDLASFGEGQALANRCQQLCEDLLKTLGEFPKAWEIINASAIGDFGSLERAPAVSAYCGLFALLMNLPDIPRLMLVALLCDVGIIRLNAGVSKELRTTKNFTVELESKIRSVPEKSLEMILDRKLSLDEKSRNILISTYERANGTGVPKGINADKISMGAQLIRFARDFDRAILLRMGEERKEPVKVLHELFAAQTPNDVYTEKFLNLVHANLIQGSNFE